VNKICHTAGRGVGVSVGVGIGVDVSVGVAVGNSVAVVVGGRGSVGTGPARQAASSVSNVTKMILVLYFIALSPTCC